MILIQVKNNIKLFIKKCLKIGINLYDVKSLVHYKSMLNFDNLIYSFKINILCNHIIVNWMTNSSFDLRRSNRI